VLQVTAVLTSSAPVANPVLHPGTAEPVSTLHFTLDAPRYAEKVFVLGSPTAGGNTPTHTAGYYGEIFTDANGQWIKLRCLATAAGPSCHNRATRAAAQSSGSAAISWTARLLSAGTIGTP
jgi:hypothetical protein